MYVVDESEERRGQAAANTVFGNQASVLVGDFLLQFLGKGSITRVTETFR